MMRHPLSSLLTALLFAACAASAGAQQRYPQKPVRLIVPFPPGGGNDIIGRFMAQKLSERLGQQVVVDNRGGADGLIGTELAAKAPPDGHTLLVVSSSFAMNPAIYKLPYDSLKSFTAIAQIGSGANVLAVHPSVPAANVRELVALAREHPGQLRYASSGIGGFNHFGGELFKMLAGIDMLHVPYKGGGPAMIDVMSGQVEVLFATLIQALPNIRNGKLRGVGVGSQTRSPLLPAVPTVVESGVTGYDGSIWWGILGPAGMPPEIVSRLNTEVGNVLRDPEAAKRLATEAAEPVVATPEAFYQVLARDIPKWIKVAQQAGIKAH